MQDWGDLLPQDKRDTDRAEALVKMGYPAVAPIIPQLLEWMQDINWPVAQTLQPLIAGIGAPLTDHIRPILASDDTDWKFWILNCVIFESPELQVTLRNEIMRLALHPIPGEQGNRVDMAARQILACVEPGDSMH